jgi:hypothetical protein
MGDGRMSKREEREKGCPKKPPKGPKEEERI